MSELAKAHAEIERLNRIVNSGDTLRDHAIRKAMQERDDALARLAEATAAWHDRDTRLLAVEARLAEAESNLLEATMLLFDWDALVGGTGSHATETRAFLERVGYDPMTATLRTDSAPAVRCPATLGNAGQCVKEAGHDDQHSLVDVTRPDDRWSSGLGECK